MRINQFTYEQELEIFTARFEDQDLDEAQRLTSLYSLFECRRCQKIVNGLEVVHLNDLPGSTYKFTRRYPAPMRGDYCPECVPHMLAAHSVVCEVCHDIYYESNASGWRKTCPECRLGLPKEEARRIAYQKKESRKAGVAFTLTVAQWLETLDYFGRRCAYCGGDYQVLEHYIPVSRGGGTTADNCVPACVPCNRRKFDMIPDDPIFTHVANFLVNRSELITAKYSTEL
jgi:5-methylcytosine-specific restriction endonuclease McrA